MQASTDATVLVTGASGFIAMHCILKLFEQGYKVRGTLRSPERETGLRETFSKYIDDNAQLQFITADLGSDDGWDEAVHGCQFILHVASPFTPAPPKHEDDHIIPAREGTMRVLKAAVAANVKRVVMTSSIVAIVIGHDRDASRTFTENDWSQLERGADAYQKSKTIAERAAWDFVNGLKGDDPLELAVINPGLVLGPILDADFSPSGEVIRKLMRREYPGCPDLGWPVVDVRDVAEAHIAAMITPEATGKRFICAIENYSMQEIAIVLNKAFAQKGYKIPTRRLPNFIMRIASIWDKTARLVINDLGHRTEVSNDRIKKVLNWKPRSLEEMVVSMANSMIDFGVVQS